eukprot:TRINITY_DN8216_c0_g1_i10.p1 TRINITY_DN8216_c0_g1~~TRINITY_DN8216_c0_g1_i10.p1  ORF type:complete len:751 (-),score=158.97 TRINITY_DN8216_c0_g1_i10:189-2441(-)
MNSIRHGDRDIKIIAEALQPNSLALIFGDHGGTREGRHGGGSKEELESGLFAYSKKNFTFRLFKYPELLPARTQELLKTLGPAVDIDFLNRKGFNQIDGVPTTAAIYNIPIPFSNLGTVIPEVLHYDNCTVADCLYELYMEHVLNYVQVLNYLDAFVRKFKVMEDQLKLVEDSFADIKRSTLEIMADSEDVFRIEQSYVKDGGMTEEAKAKYVAFVSKLSEMMRNVREVLDSNSLAFKEQWSSINKSFLYSSLFIRATTTAGLFFVILLLYASIKIETADFFSHLLTKGYLSFFLLIVFVLIFFNIEYVGLFLLIVFPICLWFAYSAIKLCREYKGTIKALVNAESNLIPTVMGVAFVFLIFALDCFYGNQQREVIQNSMGILSILYLVVFFVTKTRRVSILLLATALVIFNRWIFDFHKTKNAQRYTLCSIVPTFILLGIGVYLILRKVASEMYFVVKTAFVLTLVATSLGMLHYQIKEVSKDLKSSYFCYIVLPRSIFALSVLQMIYLVISLGFKRLLWKTLPPKKDRVFAFFLLLLTGTIPSLLLLVGPHHQIFYLALLLVAYTLSYTLHAIGHGNSFFFSVIYFFTMNFFYFATGHVLDFMALRVQRAFVGFPDFKTEINFPIVFFETGGVFSFMMAMLPLLSMMHDSENYKYRQCEQEPSEVPMGNSNSKEMRGDDNRVLETVIGRNYLMNLFNFEMTHNGLSAYLVRKFSSEFFSMSPTEFTFRFINWYMYILTFGFLYIIGKV